jgi:uncharacterized protein (DUF433 family)
VSSIRFPDFPGAPAGSLGGGPVSGQRGRHAPARPCQLTVTPGRHTRLAGSDARASHFPNRSKEVTMTRRTRPHPRIEPAVLDWHDRITLDPAILVGKPCIKGTRISVELIVEVLADGWTYEQILESWDHITKEDILACLAYASDVLKMEFVHPPEP